MAYINSQLGIPVNAYFDGSSYMNASGRSRNEKKRRAFIFGGVIVGTIYNALTPSERRKYNEVMGKASNPQSDKIAHYEKDIVTPKFPYDKNMSSEQLAAVIDSLTKEYNRYDIDRDSKAGAVARSTKSWSKDPNRSLISQLQEIRAMMQAINDYRAEVVKAYNKAFEREQKQEEARLKQEETQKTQTYPSPKPPGIVGGTPVSLPPVGMDVGASLPPTTDGGTGSATPTTDKNKKMLMYGVGGLVVVGALVYFLTK